MRGYDEIRAPHYKALYEVLDGDPRSNKPILRGEKGVDEEREGDEAYIEEIVKKGLGANTGWIYTYDVGLSPFGVFEFPDIR